MSTDAATIATARRLRRRAFSLGAANGFDYAVQFLMPMVLVRCLDTQAFGQYRLLWLVVGTVVAFANLAMPSSLFYFLPRSDKPTRQLYVNQTLIYLLAAGAIAALAVSPLNPVLPSAMQALTAHGAFVPAFVALWALATLLDELPTAEERVRWQARSTIGLATMRALALSVVAVVTRDLGAVFVALLALALFKVGLLLFYIARYHGLGKPLLELRRFADQLRYAAPFGAGGALYVLRVQADQWVAAAVFPVASFASFSIAAVLGPLLHVVRHAVSAAFLPSMSRLQAGGDIRSAIGLNTRANIMVGTIVYPMIAFVFVFAEDLVTLVYTGGYVDAAPVMRVYLIGLCALVVELATMAVVLRQGAFMLRLNSVTIAFSIGLSWFAAQYFGLPGAAVGSVTVAYTDRFFTLHRISRLTGIRVAKLQDWRALLTLLAISILAGLLAWACSRTIGDSLTLVRVLAGAVVLATTYAALYWSCARHVLPVRDGHS